MAFGFLKGGKPFSPIKISGGSWLGNDCDKDNNGINWLKMIARNNARNSSIEDRSSFNRVKYHLKILAPEIPRYKNNYPY